jgi:hypothetical protein
MVFPASCAATGEGLSKEQERGQRVDLAHHIANRPSFAARHVEHVTLRQGDIQARLGLSRSRSLIFMLAFSDGRTSVIARWVTVLG